MTAVVMSARPIIRRRSGSRRARSRVSRVGVPASSQGAVPTATRVSSIIPASRRARESCSSARPHERETIDTPAGMDKRATLAGMYPGLLVRRGVGAVVAAVAVAAAAVIVAGTAAEAAPPPSRSLATGVVDQATFAGPESAAAFRRVRAAGASVARVIVDWRAVAPTARPAGFRDADPRAPQYRWAAIDRQVRQAVAAGLQPILTVTNAPAWATEQPSKRGPYNPSAAALGRFATAAATRYGGAFETLPRVRYWQVWNEPNLNLFLTPQFTATIPTSPALYRALVNRFAAAVHRAHADNLVVAGGLSPFTVSNGYAESVAPLRFMRNLLCMSAGAHPRATCSSRVEFDVWSHHPYTSGDPTHKARLPDDVSLGDLPEMRRLLDAAVAARHVVHRVPVRFWVTEFSWDTNPPDPKAVPATLHARWVAEAMYRMWQAGVSLVVWFQLRDEPPPPNYDFQSGLWFRGGAGLATDRPKPALAAFRFPFVAFSGRRGIDFWGRVPASAGANVELYVAGRNARYRRVLRVRANGVGVFAGRFRAPAGAKAVRAR